MKVQVFASLKEHFEQEFELAEPIQNVEALKAHLAEKNGAAGGILSVCRFAVDDTFVKDDYRLQKGDTICILPPSSGG
ncbi:MoaD/ThiS family protein [Cesiribacter sp. SM1]|uniref:MoaD/ThiS family protein n=1 Tax=Cesiribacter sp. SM1 TaxID=2861196 RepID=UPI001CD75B53|nr:MoaD/ThiS family protein [Cesiribacter sp. SM1]